MPDHGQFTPPYPYRNISSTSLVGMEKPIPSFKEFAARNPSVRTDKPLPPAPSPASSVYSLEESPTSHQEGCTTMPSPALLRPTVFRSSTSDLPRSKSLLLRPTATLRKSLDTTQPSRIRGADMETPPVQGDYNGLISHTRSAQLVPAELRGDLQSCHCQSSLVYEQGIGSDSHSVDYTLIPCPLLLRKTTEPDRPMSRFSMNSDDSTDEAFDLKASLLSHLRKPFSPRAPHVFSTASDRPWSTTPSLPVGRSEKPTRPRILTTFSRQGGQFEQRFSSSPHDGSQRAYQSPHDAWHEQPSRKRSMVHIHDSRPVSGEKAGRAARTSTMAVSELQRRAAQLKSAMLRAKTRCLPSDAERMRKKMRKHIVVVRRNGSGVEGTARMADWV
ncbi:MAG: hypothetical protein M1817_004954 [Caeruleum heppii]|nr:MAG: hypothetical protein M1817_004954 [Caeruleum heppii]